MVKFFRKIRQRLLSQNRLRKYTLYAIGEIILVMIGILLALQVNNWNTNRRKNHKSNYYLNEILENLKYDTLNINGILAFNNEKREALHTAANELGSPETQANRLMAIGRRYNLLGGYYVFEPNRIGYSNMMSAESIELIQNDSIRGVLAYYYGFDYKGYRQVKHKEICEEFIEYYNHNYMTKEFVNLLFNIEVDIRSDYDVEIWNDPKVYSYFALIEHYMNFQDFLLNEKKKTLISLIDQINTELSLE